MNEVFVLIKITAMVIGISVAVLGMMSFVMWQNPFRFIKPMFAVRVLVALVAYAWFLCFIPGASQ
ncbi:hypothetical protein SS21_11305 [Enterobacter roggenkampii]|uniref:hypothetical protein n=1 Tax=Enterobacter roggenkampii TaxID=1812935 RepID=UPI0005EE1F86|nr:hypothetical protein [Enterobacter roggenkampii]HCW3069782.1 hypothetical protein [Citrobacter freundii]KJM88619.1 hypothetical protein SS21_11305 [Enterobacter roggenkampii]KJN51286.1 hypothetical protein SS51_23285 [Enterobacter roggenkampii]HCW3106854.1 hypothetical protein [Citrobacter freundii]HCW3131485.1 hypothetical protein [Citrobacter freundii]